MIIYMHEFTMQMFSYPETQSRRQAEGIINCADNNPRLMVKEDQYCKKTNVLDVDRVWVRTVKTNSTLKLVVFVSLYPALCVLSFFFVRLGVASWRLELLHLTPAAHHPNQPQYLNHW